MRALGTLPGLLALVATSLAGQVPKKSHTPPDIFLVTIDTLRADHVHCTDTIASKHRDWIHWPKMAFVSRKPSPPSPITNTSHTSILTGLLPSTHGVTDFAVPLAIKNPTLAELLKKGGTEQRRLSDR